MSERFSVLAVLSVALLLVAATCGTAAGAATAGADPSSSSVTQPPRSGIAGLPPPALPYSLARHFSIDKTLILQTAVNCGELNKVPQSEREFVGCTKRQIAQHQWIILYGDRITGGSTAKEQRLLVSELRRQGWGVVANNAQRSVQLRGFGWQGELDIGQLNDTAPVTLSASFVQRRP